MLKDDTPPPRGWLKPLPTFRHLDCRYFVTHTQRVCFHALATNGHRVARCEFVDAFDGARVRVL